MGVAVILSCSTHNQDMAECLQNSIGETTLYDIWIQEGFSNSFYIVTIQTIRRWWFSIALNIDSCLSSTTHGSNFKRYD